MPAYQDNPSMFGNADQQDTDWLRGADDCINRVHYYTTRGTSAEMKAAEKILADLHAMRLKVQNRRQDRTKSTETMRRLFEPTKL